MGRGATLFESEVSEQVLALLREIAAWQGSTLPTAPALAERLGYADESGVRYHLKQAGNAGWLRIITTGNAPKAPRIPVLTEAGRTVVSTHGFKGNLTDFVQLVEPSSRTPMRAFEMVHAGADCGSIDTTPRLASLEENLGVRPDDDYSFRVVGECMLPVFRPDDVLVMRPTSYPPDGSIVHVDLGKSGEECEPLLRQISNADGSGRVALTHFYPRKRTVHVPREDVLVRGRFVGVWRDEAAILEQLREFNSHK